MRLASFFRRTVATAAIATPLAAQQPTPPTVALAPEAPAIVTSGIGEARTTPDRAVIQIGVQSRAATASAAAAANATRQRAIIDTLVALGIPRTQITTTQYNVFPESQHDPRENRERVIGYIVSNVVRIELRRTDQVGPAIDAALAKGANQVNSLNFYAENTDEPRRQALAQAVARARADADALARAAGGSLGELLELSTGQLSQPVPVPRAMMAMARDATPVEPGEEVVRATVTARWRFVPGR